MQKVSQVGKQLREKRKQTEEALRTEFQETLHRLEQNLTELSSNKLTQIESDIIEKIEQIVKFGKEKIQRLVNANHNLYKETIKAEKEKLTEELKKWRKLLLILLPTALIIGVTLGTLATVYYYKDSVKVNPEKIIVAKDGTKWYNLSEMIEEK